MWKLNNRDVWVVIKQFVLLKLHVNPNQTENTQRENNNTHVNWAAAAEKS